MFKFSTSRLAKASLYLSAAFVAAVPLHAQSAQPAGSGEEYDGDEIIVTGRAGAEQRKVEASYAISTISEDELQTRAPLGVGEALKSVPGFWIENTGGEGSGNLRVRGIPTDGYSTVGVLEDGLPIQADAGLGWLNADQSIRLDQTVGRIEVVRGGPSSIFYSNAPGAVINFITERGGDELAGLARYEFGDYGSHRVDATIGGPIGNSDWRFFAGGYYRLSDGVRDSGFRQDEGGQGRLTLSRNFDRGSIMLGVKRIDERIGNAGGGIFFTNADGDPEGVPGYDSQHGTITGPNSRYFSFPTADGAYELDSSNGTNVELTQLTFTADYDLTDTVRLEQRLRYRDSWTRRTAITPYSVASATDLLASNYGSFVQPGTSLGLSYRDSGAAFDLANQNGNGLALVNLARSYTVPLEEFITDSRLLASVDAFGSHDFAFGAYFARVNEDYSVYSSAVLTDVKNQADVLDAYLLDGAGNRLFRFTDNGVMAYGSEYQNAYGNSETFALYASDEWEITDKLRVDGGIRWEQIAIKGGIEGETRLPLNTGTGVTSTIIGTGAFTDFSRKYDHTAWTLGANYQFQPDLGLFVRYTDTFRLPSISNFLNNAAATPVTQQMTFLEGGLKFARPNFNLYLTAFQTIYKSYEISDYRSDASGNLVLNTVYGDTDTKGFEVESYWRPVEWFDIRGMWTFQDAKFDEFAYTNNAGAPIDYSGNRLIRVPEHVVRVTPGLNLMDDRFRFETVVGYYGQRYADVANQVNLPSYWQVDLNARFNVTDQLQLNLIVNNLTDELGLASGNPRQGTIENGEAGDSVYIANSIFGRTVRAAVTFRF